MSSWDVRAICREDDMDHASPGGSVTVCLDRLKAGDPTAAKPLWDGYFVRLVRLARDRLRGTPRGAADEEDVALSAFDSFYRAATGGRFPDIGDRESLWRILFTITARKAASLARHEGRQKRGGGAVTFASAPPGPDDSRADVLAGVAGGEPTPELAAAVSDECRRLLGLLGEGELRAVAIWRMEGFTNTEIGAKLGRSVQTVERKLKLIREIWGAGG